MLLAEIIDWSVALLPVLILLLLFAWLDVFKLMSAGEMLGLLMMGALAAVASYPLSGVFLDALPIGFSNYSRFVAPWIEEALKSIAVITLFRLNRIGFKIDAIISGFAIGAGFSVVENIIYLVRLPDVTASIWMVRGLGTAVMHGTTLAVLAAIAHELSERETREAADDYDFSPWWFVPGFLAAVAIHILFNQFPDRPMAAMLGTLVIAPLLLMAILRFGAAEAQQWLAVERDVHRQQLRTLQSGGFPDDESGRRVAALARRSGPDTGRLILDYCAVLTGLVVMAEDVLARQAADEQRLDADGRQAFDRLASLERELGRSTLAALKPLLPFSRNDYWELGELKERLRRPATEAR